MDTIRFYFQNYTAQVVFFLIFAIAAVPVLVYYRRRNPNPRFRPTLGEMAMVSLLAMFVCGAMAAGLGAVFNKDQEFTNLKKKADNQIPVEGTATAGSRKTEEKEAEDPAEKKKKQIIEVLRHQQR